jgi:hypothetical protein
MENIPEERTPSSTHEISRTESGKGRKRSSRRVFPPDADVAPQVSAAGGNSQITLAQTVKSPTQTQDKIQKEPPSPMPSLDPDLVYEAFVKKWCFAEGPSRGSSLMDGGTLPGPVLSSPTSSSRQLYRGGKRRESERVQVV